MKILSFNVRNILKISELDMNMEGRNLLLVGGKNAAGKSSALTALVMALCGKRQLGDQWPDVALKEGEKTGTVTVQLSGDEELHDDVGFTIELELRRKRTGVVVDEFRVLDSTGEEAPEPRKLLERLYNFKAFDPLDFERSKPADRAQMLRDLVGLDFSELDAEHAKVYAERTVINREGKSLAAQHDAMEVPDGTPDESFSYSELHQDIEDATAANRHLAEKAGEIRSLNQLDETLAAEEVKLRNRLMDIDREKQQIRDRIAAAQKVVDENEQIDVEPLKAKVRTIDETNRNVEAKKRKMEVAVLLEKRREESKAKSDRLKAIEQEKQDRLEKATYPLPGLSLDESGVVLDGLPFEQASKAQRVMASVKVGMALNPKLRLLVCQDGNDLDNDTLAALDTALQENDFQMLLEFVTRTPEDESRCAVVFKNGEAVSRAGDSEDSVDTEDA